MSGVLTDVSGSDVLHGRKASNVCFEDPDRDLMAGVMCANRVPTDVVRLHSDAILAFHMNDEPSPFDHGYPTRIVDRRHVKSLANITMSHDESEYHW